MNVMSNFAYKDSKGQLVQVPVRYGDMSRQVANILKKNRDDMAQRGDLLDCLRYSISTWCRDYFKINL
jgi:hypothetical protein